MISQSTLSSPSSIKVSASFQKWFYLTALTLIWGSSYILIKIGLQGYGYVESATLRLMAAGVPQSVIFGGPPGCGKTTLARLYAQAFGAEFIQI